MEPVDSQLSLDAVLAAERRLYQAMIDNDLAALGEILSDDLTYVHSTAIAEGKTLYLERVAASHYDYKSIDSRDVTIRIRQNLAVISGTLDMGVAISGGPTLMMHLLFVLVWTRQAGGWKLSLRQATSMPDT